jgi:hypothetical protein
MTSAVVIGSFAYLCMLLSPEVALADYRQQSTNQSTQLESNAKENLSAVADKLIAVVQDGKESELLEFWSHSGVSFGVDGAVVGKRTLLRQLQQKQDLYCFFFETDCMRKQDEEQRRAAKAPPRKDALYSYRDLLRRASAKELKVSEYKDHGALLGRVLVNLTMNEKISGERKRALEFIFANENGRWKLTSVPYD